MSPRKATLLLGPIIGGLSHEKVKFWGRADRSAAMSVWLASQADLRDVSLVGSTRLHESTGFAGIVEVTGLQPSHDYYFALVLNSRGGLPPRKYFQRFRTFPPPGELRSFRFAFGSCFRPEPVNPGRAFRHLLDHHPGLDFLLLEGDQIYADEWKYNGLGRVALTLEDYRRVYLNTWSNPHHRRLLARTPVFMTLDDHEVDNDWHWVDGQFEHVDFPRYTRWIRMGFGLDRTQRQLTTARVRDALQAYREHQAAHAPCLTLPSRSSRGLTLIETDSGDSQAYSFYFGAAAFFIMDTRTHRVFSREPSMLGEAQWQALEQWLLAVKDDFPVKFIASSSAFLFELWGDFAADRWSGFPRERDRLLNFLAANDITGVYFLVGDLHEGHVVSADLYGPNGKSIPIWEFSATPFEQLTNFLAKILKAKPRSAALRNARIHFSIDCINYGIIDVNLDDPVCPRVDFTLHYEEKGQWKTRLTRTAVDRLA